MDNEGIVKRAIENNYFDTNTRYRYGPSEYSHRLDYKTTIDTKEILDNEGLIPILNSNAVAKGEKSFGDF